MPIQILAIDRTDVPPLRLPDRLQTELPYFAEPREALGLNGYREYDIDLTRVQQIFDDGCLTLVSPLDSDNRTELELSEAQEDWLEWVLKHEVIAVRVQPA